MITGGVCHRYSHFYPGRRIGVYGAHIPAEAHRPDGEGNAGAGRWHLPRSADAKKDKDITVELTKDEAAVGDIYEADFARYWRELLPDEKSKQKRA